MALFGTKTKAMISTEALSVAPVAAGSGPWTGAADNIGANSVGNFYSYSEGVLRNNAMSVPTIARARDLIASVIGATELCMYKRQWNDQTKEMEEVEIAPRSWLSQPDPTLPYSTFMSWLFDDLFFFGKAILFINSRTADGFPNSFQRLPASMTVFRDQSGPVFFAPSNEVYFQGGQIDSANLVQFISPIQGIVYQSEQAVQTAIRLERARYRNASSTIPAGVLKITGGEPLTQQEMADLAAAFNSARENNQTAAISQDVDYQPTTANPANMLLMDAANFQALEMCRLTNIPPYLAGIDIGSYQYSSGKQAREDLYLFAARLYMDCVAQTLSMNNVLPAGTYVKFDIDDWIADVEGAVELDERGAMDSIPTPPPSQEMITE
jgi:hypothetical protein